MRRTQSDRESYIDLLMQNTVMAVESFTATSAAEDFADILSGLAEMKRLHPALRKKVQPVIDATEKLVACPSVRGSIDTIAAHLGAEDLMNRLDEVAPLSANDEEAGIKIEEFLQERDRMHLLLSELELLGFLPSERFLGGLVAIDSRASACLHLTVAAEAQKPLLALYNEKSLQGLWWWPVRQTNQRNPIQAPLPWWQYVVCWLRSHPAPALAESMPHSDLPDTLWIVGNHLGFEIALVPVDGRLWLSVVAGRIGRGKLIEKFRLRYLMIDGKKCRPVTEFRIRGRFLVPISTRPIRLAEIQISNGTRTKTIRLHFDR